MLIILTYNLFCFQVKYTLYRDRPIEERRSKFYSSCRDGNVEIVSIINNFTYKSLLIFWLTQMSTKELKGRIIFQTYPSSGLSLLLSLTSTNHHKTLRNGINNSKSFCDFSSERDKVCLNIFMLICDVKLDSEIWKLIRSPKYRNNGSRITKPFRFLV